MIPRFAASVVMLAAFLGAGLPTAWATAQDAAFYPVNSFSHNLALINHELAVDSDWPCSTCRPASFEAQVQARLQAALRAVYGPESAASPVSKLLDPIPDPDKGGSIRG